MKDGEFKLDVWTKDDYARLMEQLVRSADEDYRNFHQKLIPGVDNFLGIQIPKLRRLAREIARGDTASYFPLVGVEYYEEIMLFGLVIGYARIDLPHFFAQLDRFVPMIDNWAVCDCCCSSLKAATKHPREMRSYLDRYLRSDKEFERRFAIVMLMDYYISDEYIDDTLNRLIVSSTHEAYYVKMAVAWALSVCFVKYKDKTYECIRQRPIDRETLKMTVRKILDSYRVSPEDKLAVKQLVK